MWIALKNIATFRIEDVMAENPMLKFVKIPRLMPEKRDAKDRTHDFDEMCPIAKPIARFTTIFPIGCV